MHHKLLRFLQYQMNAVLDVRGESIGGTRTKGIDWQAGRDFLWLVVSLTQQGSGYERHEGHKGHEGIRTDTLSGG